MVTCNLIEVAFVFSVDVRLVWTGIRRDQEPDTEFDHENNVYAAKCVH